MRSDDLDGRTIAAMYEASHPLHERLWDQEGHRSYHHGFYEDEDVDPDVAVETMIRRLADEATLAAGDRVVNLGSGVGEDSVWLARERGATVVGVNIHDRQLEAAREYAREAGVSDRVTFRFDDFHELETVDDDSTDVVWGLEALCHASDDGRVVETAARVLGDDGRIVFADLFRRGGGSSGDRDRFEKLYDAWDVRYDPIDELVAALEDAGFRNVSVEDVTDAVEPSLENAYRMSLYGYPYYRLLHFLGRVDDRVVGLSIGGYHCYKLVESDAIGYYVVSAER
ncbi:cyclopropane-fatty-acyl-phospholipid synthase family protein [Halovivax sp.]|uniref:SAM-dependent methyltransferase n=1 Tax=Halovivax sp. TaxID=1935978 RepID=UPI0025BB1B02|nr:methyltransferase domain-containing protein [Halovivax sp.]